MIVAFLVDYSTERIVIGQLSQGEGGHSVLFPVGGLLRGMFQLKGFLVWGLVTAEI